MFELDELGTGGVLEEGFITGKMPYNGELTAIITDRLLSLNDLSFSVQDAIIYLMNGLYALKEEFSTVYVSIYGVIFTVSLRKYAVPNHDDTMIIFQLVKQALLLKCPTEVVETVSAPILADIISGKFIYVK